MNNRTTRTGTLSQCSSYLQAATLVVEEHWSNKRNQHQPFAYKKRGDGGNRNGNTVTIQKDKQNARESGFDTSFEEEGQIQMGLD